ncbi:MAG: hypothetical protein AB7D36_09340 [Oscillospiraceae bacterium]
MTYFILRIRAKPRGACAKFTSVLQDIKLPMVSKSKGQAKACPFDLVGVKLLDLERPSKINGLQTICKQHLRCDINQRTESKER